MNKFRVNEEMYGSPGIGHISCILASRPGMGAMLNPQGSRDGIGVSELLPEHDESYHVK